MTDPVIDADGSDELLTVILTADEFQALLTQLLSVAREDAKRVAHIGALSLQLSREIEQRQRLVATLRGALDAV